jgi:DNA-binding IclR family transcriptional regulator
MSIFLISFLVIFWHCYHIQCRSSGVGHNRGMNSLRRMLDILALVTRERPTIDVDEICATLGYAQASAYRYVKELTEAGLLVRLPRGYTLGPRIIELDLQMRETDPLLNNCRDLMQRLAAETGLNVLLSELYGETVINTHQEFGLDSQALTFGRGRPMALFLSATSTIILAHLGPRQLRRLYDRHAGSGDVMRLGASWKEFAKAMSQLRKQGFSRSQGELDVGKAGMAAPIFDETERVIGSLSLVGSVERMQAFNGDYLAKLLTAAASTITNRIAESGSTAAPATAD